jgi:hypothetical protein
VPVDTDVAEDVRAVVVAVSVEVTVMLTTGEVLPAKVVEPP